MSSRPVQQTAVYRQDTKPSDSRPGIIWVDTSGSGSPETKVCGDDGTFSPVANVPLFVTQEAVTFGESEVDLTHTKTKTASGQVEMQQREDGTKAKGSTDVDPGVSAPYEYGPVVEPNTELFGLVLDISANTGTQDFTFKLYEWNGDGTVLASTSVASVSGGDTVRLNGSDWKLQAGTQYFVAADPADTVAIGEDDSGNWPYSSSDIDIVEAADSYNSTYPQLRHILGVRGILPVLDAETAVGFSPIPDDLAAWDRLAWQYDEGGGSFTFDVETNDGSGWTTHHSDVLPPVGISGVAPDTDVRLVANFSRTDGDQTSPVLPYVARRGER